MRTARWREPRRKLIRPKRLTKKTSDDARLDGDGHPPPYFYWRRAGGRQRRTKEGLAGRVCCPVPPNRGPKRVARGDGGALFAPRARRQGALHSRFSEDTWTLVDLRVSSLV